MSDQHAEFRSRIRRLDRKQAQGAQGFVARMRADGLIVVEPRKALARTRISGRSILILVLAVVMFKGFLMAALGFDSYAYRVARLQEGTLVEQAGAFIMQADPLSIKIAETLLPVLR